MEKKTTPISFEQRLWTWIGVLLFAFILAAVILFVQGNYTLAGFSNALFIPGAVVLGVIGLMFVGRNGTFDIMSYSFTRLRDSFRREKVKSFEDAYAYSEFKNSQRLKRGFYTLPFLVIGGLFVLTALVLALIR
jgi:hypothetical protein